MLFGLFFAVLLAAVLALVTGAILMIIAPMTADRTPSFGEAWKAMFIATLAQALVNFLLTLAMPEGGLVAGGVSLVAGIVVLTIVLAYQIEATLLRALLTAVVLNLIVLGLLVGIGFVIGVASASGTAAAGAAGTVLA